ncbi:K02A2.6-like family [Trichomonas vaginalis G3]|uniref:K02A2.6-like family n=1 Tax=Trichomonas vaginalis (strain ATCC PRA-98 / G3) TaxID=412133 RepID=UPI0021E6250D|nr:K02A2.6-like family [Trichomonas vaginalis G3]KAI5546447.1 K02A2.6-like family [Trichomonas vaginalis G3]
MKALEKIAMEKHLLPEQNEENEETFDIEIYKQLQSIRYHHIATYMNENGYSTPREYQVADPPTKYRAISKNLIWHCDIHYLYGNIQYPFFVFLDDMTRKILITKILKNKSSASTAKVLRKILREITPYCIWSDNGGENQGEFAQVMRENSIVWKHTMPYMPRQNVKVERLWPSLEKNLPLNFEDIAEVKRAIEKFVENYNNTPHCSLEINPDTSTEYTPNELYSKAPFWYEPGKRKWELFIKDQWIEKEFE